MLGKKLYNKTVSIVPLVTTYISFRCLISWTVWKASSCSFPGAKLSLIAFWNTSWRMVPISIWRVAGSELYQKNTKIIQISYFTTYQQMWSYIYYLTYWTTITKVHWWDKCQNMKQFIFLVSEIIGDFHFLQFRITWIILQVIIFKSVYFHFEKN